VSVSTSADGTAISCTKQGFGPAVVFVAGASAGGSLAVLAALTSNEPMLQPGFERADASIVGAISL
jgi:acetyl esterase/lipase